MSYRYQDIKTTNKDDVGTQYLLNNVYPDVPISEDDNYVITTLGDRLDLLAMDFYKDVTLWWVIASANSLSGDSLYPPIGMQLRIPTDIQSVINQYKKENLTR